MRFQEAWKEADLTLAATLRTKVGEKDRLSSRP